MTTEELTEFVPAAAAEFGVPGAAVGVWAGGREMIGCQGVTNVEHPLPGLQLERVALNALGVRPRAGVLRLERGGEADVAGEREDDEDAGAATRQAQRHGGAAILDGAGAGGVAGRRRRQMSSKRRTPGRDRRTGAS